MGAAPQFSNPFERAHSPEKVPSIATSAIDSSLISTVDRTSPTSPPSSTGWRSRAASIFQSVSSDASRRSSNSNAQQMRTPAVRKSSYVPQYAARAHLQSMTGRTHSTTSVEIEEQLRRESRVMSVINIPGVPGPSTALTPMRKAS